MMREDKRPGFPNRRGLETPLPQEILLGAACFDFPVKISVMARSAVKQ